MEALLDLAVKTDHVFAHALRTQPDRARHRVALLQPAVTPPPDMETALEHDDDFGVADLDLAEVAFRMPPALRQQTIPSALTAGPQSGAGNVFRSSVTAQTTHADSPRPKFTG